MVVCCLGCLTCRFWRKFRGMTAWQCVVELLYSLLDGLLDTLDCLARLLGPCLLLCATAIISLNTYLYFSYLSPSLGPSPLSPVRALCTATGVFVLYNLAYNYTACVFSDPGRVAGLPLRDMWQLAQRYDPSYRLAPIQTVDDLRWCEECASVKPKRVHHCSVCKCCVLKMDHHCPWVSNCVGVRTYPYFVRLLVWAILGAAFMSAVGSRAAWAQLSMCDASATAASAQAWYPAASNPSPTSITQVLSSIRAPSSTSALRGATAAAPGRLLLSTEYATPSLPLAAHATTTTTLAATAAATARQAASALASAAATLASLPAATHAMLHPTPTGCIRVYLVLYAVTASLGLALTLLAGFHLYLTSTGQSSIEFYKNRRSGAGWCSSRCCRGGGGAEGTAAAATPAPPARHAFDAGSCSSNWQAVFRSSVCSGAWLLPPSWVGLGEWGLGAGPRAALRQSALYRVLCGGGGGGSGGGGSGGRRRKRHASVAVALGGAEGVLRGGGGWSEQQQQGVGGEEAGEGAAVRLRV